MIVISPWSKGGWVNSEVFDHTSLIRFLETRFGVLEPNITPWRRAVAGNLTSAFNFATPNDAIVALPDTSSYAPTDQNRRPDYVPKPPNNQALPQQEPGTRPARAVPYELHVSAEVAGAGVRLFFRNTGTAGAVFQVRSGDGLTGRWTYTVGAGDQTSDTLARNDATSYDYAVFGPNGFLRRFAGTFAARGANLKVKTIYEKEWEGIAVGIRNHGSSVAKVSIFDVYSGQTHTQHVQPNENLAYVGDLHKSFGWYDFRISVECDAGFQRQLAGHVETGRPSMSDPAIGAAAAQTADVA